MGDLVKIFRKNGISSYGVDINKNRISEKEKIFFCDVSKQKFPFEDQKFDLLISLDVV
jgi:hypothetical protein